MSPRDNLRNAGWFMLLSVAGASAAASCSTERPDFSTGDGTGGKASAGDTPHMGGARDSEAPDGTCATGSFMASSVCKSWTDCEPGERQIVQGTQRGDRECGACPSGQYSTESNAPHCQAWSDCGDGEYVETAGTAKADRICAPCPEGTFSTQPNSQQCVDVGDCPSGTVKTAAASADQDTQCTACQAGNYCAGGDAPAAACANGTWDGGSTASPCIEHSTCPTGTFAINTPNATTDRQCLTWSTCRDNQRVIGQATSQLDRMCEPCPPGTESRGPNATTCTNKIPTYSQLVTTAYYFTCGLRIDDQQAQCWGDDTFNGLFEEPQVQFLSLASDAQVCGIRKNDNKVQCWGEGESASTPPTDVPFQSIALGNEFGCGILLDGRLQCWGDDTYAQATPPSGTFTAIGTGGRHACGLRSNGSVACWGRDDGGDTTDQEGPFKALAVKGMMNCGILSASSAIHCWGTIAAPVTLTEPPTNYGFKLIGVDTFVSCATTNGGVTSCWGANPPTPPQGVVFEQIAPGSDFVCGIRADNHQAQCFGSNGNGADVPPQTWFD